MNLPANLSWKKKKSSRANCNGVQELDGRLIRSQAERDPTEPRIMRGSPDRAGSRNREVIPTFSILVLMRVCALALVVPMSRQRRRRSVCRGLTIALLRQAARRFKLLRSFVVMQAKFFFVIAKTISSIGSLWPGLWLMIFTIRADTSARYFRFNLSHKI